MPDILLPYLFDAAEIRIRVPYLRQPYQIWNVREILLQLIQHADAARLPRVVIGLFRVGCGWRRLGLL